MIYRKLAFLVLVVMVYGFLFGTQERLSQNVKPVLAIPLPSVIQKAVMGYLRNLGGEMHFIRTAVFLGGHFTNYPDETYANGLSANFRTMVDLNPYFIDSYFLCQSTLSRIDAKRAREANAILQIGMAANPDNWILPFFQSFNYNHYLREPRKAADSLRIAAKIDEAPDWLEHLASIRAAQGGDILSGLVWLKAMYSTEQSEGLRAKYSREIEDFEAALNVQKAILAYQKKYGRILASLDHLIPEFLPALPTFNEPFVLVWNPPDLQLKRPDRGFKIR